MSKGTFDGKTEEGNPRYKDLVKRDLHVVFLHLQAKTFKGSRLIFLLCFVSVCVTGHRMREKEPQPVNKRNPINLNSGG